MRENRTSGTVWGVSGNRHSYHDSAGRKMERDTAVENELNSALKEFSVQLTCSGEAYTLKAAKSEKSIEINWPHPLMEVFFDFVENGNVIFSESIEFYENETQKELRDYLIYVVKRFFNLPTRIESIGRLPKRTELQVKESEQWSSIFD